MNRKQRHKKNHKVKKEEIKNEQVKEDSVIAEESNDRHQEENILDDEITDIDYGTPIEDPRTFLGGIFLPLLQGGSIMNNAAMNPMNVNPALAYMQGQQPQMAQMQPQPIMPAQAQQQTTQAQMVQQPQPIMPAQAQQQTAQATAPINAETQTMKASAHMEVPQQSISAASASVPEAQQNYLKAQGVAEFKANFMSNVSPEKQEIVNMILQEATTHKPLITDDQAEKALEMVKEENDEDDDNWNFKDYALAGVGGASLLALGWFGYNKFIKDKEMEDDDTIGDVAEAGLDLANTLSKYIEI